LDTDADPLRWIEKNEGELAAITTLRILIDRIRQFLPIKPDSKVIKVARIHQRSRVERFTVEIDQIQILEAGFNISLRCRIPVKLVRLGTKNPYLIYWKGNEQVIDDLGNQYVILYRIEEGGNSLWWTNRSLQLIGYPLFASPAKRVILNFHGMKFIVHIFENQNWRQLQEIKVDDFSWQIDLRDL
jgi:hypothetical protein